MKHWIANFFTAGNLLCGLSAILLATGGEPAIAGWMVMLAAVFDAFDGKAARFFGSGSSSFGLHFDSLADMVSFGVAPAILLYQVALFRLPYIGLVLTALPVLLAAFRLARFNANATAGEHDYIGLSAPLHACLLASFVVMSLSVWGEIIDTAVLTGLIVTTSLLMVSRFPLPGLPRLSFRNSKYNLFKLVFLLLAAGSVMINPPRLAFPVMATIVLSGFIAGAIRAARLKSAHTADSEDSDQDPAAAFRGHS